MATEYILSYGEVKTVETGIVPEIKLSYGELYIFFEFIEFAGAIFRRRIEGN